MNKLGVATTAPVIKIKTTIKVIKSKLKNRKERKTECDTMIAIKTGSVSVIMMDIGQEYLKALLGVNFKRSSRSILIGWMKYIELPVQHQTKLVNTTWDSCRQNTSIILSCKGSLWLQIQNRTYILFQTPPGEVWRPHGGLL